MTIDYESLRGRIFPDVVHTYGPRDVILYALGLGLGQDPLDTNQLRYVFEDGLRILPTMSVVLGHSGFWQRAHDTGINWQSVVHGEQSLVVYRPLPVSGTVTGRMVVEEIVDKGHGRGAHLYTRRDLFDNSDGALLCTLRSNAICRADGGFGGPSIIPQTSPPLPPREPDHFLDFRIPMQAALIYRLSGDDNPLHADPAVAHIAGFERPILHGLCTYGIAGFVIAAMAAAGDASRLRRLDVRFSSPVYPGDLLRTDLWVGEQEELRFRCRVVERQITVLDRGFAQISH